MSDGWKVAEGDWAKWLPGAKRHPSQGVSHEDLSGGPPTFVAEHKETHYCPAWLRDALREEKENRGRHPGALSFIALTIQHGQGVKATRLMVVPIDFNHDASVPILEGLVRAKGVCP